MYLTLKNIYHLHHEDKIMLHNPSMRHDIYRAPRPPTFPTFPTKQVGTSYFEENSPTFPTFYQFYKNVILI